MVNFYARYQKEMSMNYLFPAQSDNTCACGCKVTLTGRKKKWASRECMINALNEYYIIKGNAQVIRHNLFLKDNGICNLCGQHDEKWQADHIHPVFKGGGACTLDNFQTLCSKCHINKSYLDSRPNSSNCTTLGRNVSKSRFNSFRTFDKSIFVDII